MQKEAQGRSKLLYKVEFWQENGKPEPILTQYVKAFSPKQAKKALRERALQEARSSGKYQMAHLFIRDDILVTAEEIQENPLKKKPGEARKQEIKNANVCPKCEGEVEDDYCQNCGWHRESWLSRARRDEEGAAENN